MNTESSESSFNSTENIFISKLTPELVKRAEIEVNEKDNWRERDIQALREIVINEISLNCQSDDQFLLRFLRARLFDYDKALHLIKKYYYMQSNSPELFPPMNKLKPVFNANTMTVLPGRTNTGETIIILEAGRWDPRKFNFDTLMAACIASMETAILDEVTQITGMICIIDMSEFGWTQLRRFGPSQARKIVNIIDESLPIRFKTIHIINESTLADIAFTIMKPFLNEELRNKIVFHGTILTELHSIVSPDVLPQELGGTEGPLESRSWYESVQSSDSYFLENRVKYGFRKFSNRSISDFESIEGGLFRKSQTCNGYLFDYYRPSKAE